jgi:hypothetical protein
MVAVVWRPSSEGVGAALGRVAEARVRGTGETTMDMVGGGEAGSPREWGMGATSGLFPEDICGSNRQRLARGRAGLGDIAFGETAGVDTGEVEAAGIQTCTRSLASPSPDNLLLEGVQPTPCTSNTGCGPCQGTLSLSAGVRYSANRADSLAECLR